MTGAAWRECFRTSRGAAGGGDHGTAATTTSFLQKAILETKVDSCRCFVEASKKNEKNAVAAARRGEGTTGLQPQQFVFLGMRRAAGRAKKAWAPRARAGGEPLPAFIPPEPLSASTVFARRLQDTPRPP